MKSETEKKLVHLKKRLREMDSVLIAFSGGVDSTFLLKVAQDVLGDRVLAVIARSETYPIREEKEALRRVKDWNIRHKVIHTRELENPDFTENSPQRCYFCKKELFAKLKEIAKEEGVSFVCDGANSDDLEDFRPGARAAEELGVRSPLKEAGLGKEEIRELSRRMGLPTWNKPSMACLSSRFPYYTEIKKEALEQVGKAEEFLKARGFTQIRVRHHGDTARIEVNESELGSFFESGMRRKIVEELKRLGFTYVTLDLSGYRTGSMNEPFVQLKPKS